MPEPVPPERISELALRLDSGSLKVSSMVFRLTQGNTVV